MAQGREHQRLIARIALARHQVERGLKPQLAHLRQQARAAGAVLLVRHIQAVQQQQVAQMEDLQAVIEPVKSGQIQQPVGPRRVEKGALAAGVGHHLRHGGGGKGGALHPLAVDVILVEHGENVIPVMVIPHQSHRLQRDPGVHFRHR